MAKGIEVTVQYSQADPNERCDAQLLNDITAWLQKNGEFNLQSADENVAFVWTGFDEPPGNLRGIPWVKQDENGRTIDLFMFYSGRYVPLTGISSYRMAMYMPDNLVQTQPKNGAGLTVPWREVAGAPDVVGTTTTYKFVEWVGFPNPWN